MLRGIRRNFFRLSPCCGQVPYVLLTRAPVAGGSASAPPLPLDLHVLSLSLAFILSQDQTLRCCLSFSFLFYFKKERKTNQSVLVILLSQKPVSLRKGAPGLFGLRWIILWKLTKGHLHCLGLTPSALVSCTTSSSQLFQCSLAFGRFAGKLCKGTNYFRDQQIFQQIFETF